MTAVALPPMPHAIAALPRDRRGYPVPYVASWTSDTSPDVRRWEFRDVVLPGVTWHGQVVVSTDVVGEGVPLLGKVEPRRQLNGHLDPRCNVCGLVIGKRMVYVGGNPRAMTEAPLHRECARWALRTCPGLLARVGDDLWVVETAAAARAFVGEFVNPFAPDAAARSWMLFSQATNLHGLLCVRVDPGGRAWPADAWLAERAS